MIKMIVPIVSRQIMNHYREYIFFLITKIVKIVKIHDLTTASVIVSDTKPTVSYLNSCFYCIFITKNHDN